MIKIRAWSVFSGEEREYGPFSLVQVTYNSLRVDPEGDRHIAVYNPVPQDDPSTLAQEKRNAGLSTDYWEFDDGFQATDFAFGCMV